MSDATSAVRLHNAQPITLIPGSNAVPRILSGYAGLKEADEATVGLAGMFLKELEVHRSVISDAESRAICKAIVTIQRQI